MLLVKESFKELLLGDKGKCAMHLEGVDFSLRSEPCSYDGIVHYSYDYAQQLHYPSDPH